MITEITSGVVYLSTSSWKLDYTTVQNRMLRFDLSKHPLPQIFVLSSQE